MKKNKKTIIEKFIILLIWNWIYIDNRKWWGQGRAQGKRRLNIQRFKNCGLVLMSDLLSTFDSSFELLVFSLLGWETAGSVLIKFY